MLLTKPLCYLNLCANERLLARSFQVHQGLEEVEGEGGDGGGGGGGDGEGGSKLRQVQLN
jgi:hypothetical protein